MNGYRPYIIYNIYQKVLKCLILFSTNFLYTRANFFNKFFYLEFPANNEIITNHDFVK